LFASNGAVELNVFRTYAAGWELADSWINNRSVIALSPPVFAPAPDRALVITANQSQRSVIRDECLAHLFALTGEGEKVMTGLHRNLLLLAHWEGSGYLLNGVMQKDGRCPADVFAVWPEGSQFLLGHLPAVARAVFWLPIAPCVSSIFHAASASVE
jgi:hypothetical protein